MAQSEGMYFLKRAPRAAENVVRCRMRPAGRSLPTPELHDAGINSNSLERTLAYTRTFGNKVQTGHTLRENNLTKRITSLLFGERKKDAYEQLKANRRY